MSFIVLFFVHLCVNLCDPSPTGVNRAGFVVQGFIFYHKGLNPGYSGSPGYAKDFLNSRQTLINIYLSTWGFPVCR
jgi:hypothetical protein